MLDGIRQKALDELGLCADEVAEIEPITFDNYLFGKGVDREKKGKDGIWRSDQYQYTILFFSEKAVHCCRFAFHTTEAHETRETEVYFYSDVVSVTTESETIVLGNINVERKNFKLTTSGGTTFTASLRDANEPQRAINAMRALLRAKKQ